MKFIVDEIDPTECPFNYYGECRCGQYMDDCDYNHKDDPDECGFCISIRKIKTEDGDPD